MLTMKNEEIKADKVLLIDEAGENLGEHPIQDALGMADTKSLDLVQVSEKDIPVCKIMDYSKVEYERKKKSKNKNKGKKQVPVGNNKAKELRFKTNIGENDISVKAKQIDKFLSKNFEVKFLIKCVTRYNQKEDYFKDFAKQILDHVEVDHKLAQPYKFSPESNTLKFSIVSE